jgi:hypothetical protein
MVCATSVSVSNEFITTWKARNGRYTRGTTGFVDVMKSMHFTFIDFYSSHSDLICHDAGFIIANRSVIK